MASKKMRVAKDDNKSEKNKAPRNKFTYGGSIIILALIIVAFVWMPSRGGFFVKKNPNTFGVYKGTPIEFAVGNFLHDRFLGYYRSAVDQYQKGQRQQDPDSPWEMRGFWYKAYQDTVIRTAMLKLAKEKKLAVSVSQINSDIRQNESKYQENDEFSQNLFQQTPRSKQNEIFKEHKENLIESETIDNIITNARISDAEKSYIDSIAMNEKQFSIVAYKLSEYPEEEVVKYGGENSDLFRKIGLSKITITSEKSLADDIHKQLMENSRLFEDLASQHSTDMYKDKGGKMGWVYKYELDNISEKDVELLMNLQREEISPVIENDFGWSIYRCDDAARAADMTNSEDIEKIRSYLNFQASGQIEDYFVARANELRTVALETNLGTAAARGGRSVTLTGFFPITYGTVSISFYGQTQPVFKQPGTTKGENVLASATTNQSFLEDLNKLKKDEISQPLIAGQYVMIASLSDSRELSEEELGYQRPSIYLPILSQQYYQIDYFTSIMDSKDLKDNFQNVVVRLLKTKNEL